MVKRKTYRLREGEIIEVEEFHDGNYGAPGRNREKKRKPTPEQMQRVNEINKARRCRHRLLNYFKKSDLFITWTYEVKNRPTDMKGALKDFQKAIRYVKKEYQKRGKELFWIRNIEKGTKGAWHIHIVVNEIGDSATIMKNAWKKGGSYMCQIRQKEEFSQDMSQLANYLVKNEATKTKKNDGTEGKPRIAESSYSTSRNMPLPEPKVDKIIRWREKPKIKKGYVLLKHFEGINPATGYSYRRYTMIRDGGEDDEDGEDLC